ncbi:MAG: hypothetical protein LBQ27_03985 [Clostridiales bacterium]|jgi:hypothetical protein|nr:hypothetical protein [Clostridiales bacterium]
MDTNLIKEQTKLDIENSRKSFLLGHLFPFAYVLIISALLAGGIFLLSKSGNLPDKIMLHDTPGIYFFEYALIFTAIFLAIFILVIGPAIILFFGVSYRLPLELSYKGHSPLVSVFYGMSVSSYKLMKILLFGIIIGFIAFAPPALFFVVGFVAPVLGLSQDILTVITILKVLSILYAVFIMLKFAMTPYYIADDDDNTLKLWETLTNSWQTMRLSVIFDYIKLNILTVLLQIVVFIPFIAGAVFFGIVLMNIPAVADILGFSFLADLPVELPALPSLLPKNLPSIDIDIAIAGGIFAVSAITSYVLNLIFVKPLKSTANANFYNLVKFD